MKDLPSQTSSNEALVKYYRSRISELTMEQLRLHPFAFNLMDAPSDTFQNDSFYLYWDAEDNIQHCRNELIKLKGINV